MISMNITQAKAHLSELVAAAERGEKVQITRAGKPAVDMTLSEAAKDHRKPEFGFMQGKIWIADDFDDPLPEEELALWE